MTSGKVARLFVVTLLMTGSLARAAGPAPDKMACIAADTDGQALRLTGKLIQARKRFTVCGAASCPGIVRDDCLERIAEVEVAQPTVVFTATNGDGRSLVAVRVSVDGARIADRLDGRPLPIDPGEHVFEFEAVGRLTAQMGLTLNEGEKNVRHAVVLRAASGDPADQVPVPAPLPPADLIVPATVPVPSPTAASSIAPTDASAPAVREAAPLPAGPTADDAAPKRRIAALAAGGLGAVGIAVGTIFGLITLDRWNDLQRQCVSHAGDFQCPTPALVSEGQTEPTDAVISTIAFVAGGAGIAAGAWLWFTARPSSKSGDRISILPAAGSSHGQLLIRGRF